MRPLAHVVGSLASGCVTGFASASIETGVACFFSGILIDVDHIIDYYNRPRHHSFHDFMKTTAWGPQGRLYLFLHAWEYLPLIMLLSLYGPLQTIARGVFWGILVHLVMDQYYNRAHPLTYFILFRWYCAFAPSCFFRDEDTVELEHTFTGKFSLRPWKESSS